ncbi:MAG: hypothetical protein ACRET0_03345 [Steroidobacteraceae bacterium]
MTLLRGGVRGLVAVTALLPAACATYHRLPLPAGSNLARVSPEGLAPLDMNRVATLEVLNNPT